MLCVFGCKAISELLDITRIHCSMVARLYALLLLSHLLLIIKPRRIISNYVIIIKQKMRPKVAKTVHVP